MNERAVCKGIAQNAESIKEYRSGTKGMALTQYAKVKKCTNSRLDEDKEKNSLTM